VSLDYGKHGLSIVVGDLGHGAGRTTFAAGHGVIGMRERAALYGGSLEAAPLSGGGFEVRCFLPQPEGVSPLADVQIQDVR
jgi:signal transduction histidine kinase